MMIKLTTLCTAVLLGFGSAVLAQNSKPALNAAPENPVAATTNETTENEEKGTDPETVKAAVLPRLSYQMEMGASVGSGRYGYSATYLRPTAYYNINNRFRAFTSLTYLNINGLGSGYSEDTNRQAFGSQHYILE